MDCSYVLKALGKGSYYSRLNSQGSNLYKLYAKSCMTSENIEITLEYLEALAGNQDRNLSPLEEEALVYWIFLPYTSTNTPKREKKKEYLIAILNCFAPEWKEKYNDINEESAPKQMDLHEKNNIIYDAERCELELIDSVSGYVKDNSFMKQQDTGRILYFPAIPGFPMPCSPVSREAPAGRRMKTGCTRS